MQIKKIHIFTILLIPIIFLVVSIFTLSDYGFNWDEPFHFYRGQAYLHFLLTGNKDYRDLAKYPRLNEKRCATEAAPSDCKFSPIPLEDIIEYKGQDQTIEKVINSKFTKSTGPRRSYFQHDSLTYNEIIKNEDGHPPLGGILAALTNRIFYQNLKIMGDVESHHLAEVLISFIGLVGVGFFVYYRFGLLASIFSTASIALYPLFFSEAHFNVKDPVLASFFGLTIICFYFGLVKRSWKMISLSAVFAGLALGAKFNALFLPFILFPWTLFYFIKEKIKFEKKHLSVILSLVFYPVIIFLIFYILWPYLWPDPLANIQKNIQFYQSIGSGTPGELQNFVTNKINTFATKWIIWTTPIPILIFSFVGFLYSVIQLVKKRDPIFALILLWLMVPILRVSVPNTAIHGGVRQIMEFVLPLGILSGIGVLTFINLSKNLLVKRLILVGIIFSFLFVIFELARLHPNENVYFNQLIGGLSGAKEKNVPYWGNSYGNAYLQGVEWLNQNAEPGARLGLPLSTMANIPRLKLRADIIFGNWNYSGPNREGEYEMEITHNYPQRQWYGFAYYETFLDPVYETKVDNVAILKIWKNDLGHTRKGFEEEEKMDFKVIEENPTSLKIDLGKTINLTRVTISHGIEGCKKQKGGLIRLSNDGRNWSSEPEPIDYPQVPPSAVGWSEDNFVFLFPARDARYIQVDSQLDNSCLFKEHSIEVRGLKVVE